MLARLRLLYMFDAELQAISDEIRLIDVLPADHPAKAKKVAVELLQLSSNISDNKNLRTVSTPNNPDCCRDISSQDIQDQLITIEQKLNFLTKELTETMMIDGIACPCYRVNGALVPSIYGRYLLARRKQLQTLDDEIKAAPPPAPPTPQRPWIIRKFLSGFEIGKKFIDIIDDLWGAIARTGLPKEVVNFITPILVGAIGIIVHFTEAARAFYTAIKNIRKAPNQFRNGKIVANFLMFAAAGTGFSLSVAYIVANFGIFIAGSAFIPFLIPAMVGAIAAVAFFHNIYRYNTANTLVELNRLTIDNHRREIATLKQAIRNREFERKKLSLALPLNPTVTDVETLEKATNELARKNQLDIEDNARITEFESCIKSAQHNLEIWEHKRSCAAREATYRAIEILAAAIVIVGIILGTAAVVGAAGVATFGAGTPLAIIVVGVAIGVALKIFEHVDSRHQFKASNKILNSIKTFLFGSNSKTDLTEPRKKQEHILTIKAKEDIEAVVDNTIMKEPGRSARLFDYERESDSEDKTPEDVPLPSGLALFE